MTHIIERGIREDRDALMRSEVIATKGPYFMVWRSDAPEDKRYGVLKTYGDLCVFSRVRSFALQSDAERMMRGLRRD